MDAALPTLVEFLAEEGRSTGAWQNLADAGH
jgi:LysR family glycine cleavage system transcriptional activator